MPRNIIRQTSFAMGEVDHRVWKRTDQKGYLQAAQSLENMEVATVGLAKKRKGMEMVADATACAVPTSKMFEFIDKNGNHYLVLAGNFKFCIYETQSDFVYVIDWEHNFIVDEGGDQIVIEFNQLIEVQEVATPYNANIIQELDYTQVNDALIFTHPSHQPLRLFISDYTTVTFAIESMDIYPPPSYDFNLINYASYTASFSNPSSTTFQLVLSGAGAGSFTTAWINGIVIGLGTSDIDPLGYGIITNVVPGVGTVTFTGNVVVGFATPADMPTVGSQYSIRQPVFSVDLGYPAKCLFYQSRLWFATTPFLPNTIFGSKINKPVDFDVGTGRDTDAIVSTIGQTDSGAILWLNGGKQLEIYTEFFEFVCPQESNAALTPSTFSIRQQSSYGASDILKPVAYSNNSYYVAKTGKSVINYAFQGVGLAYKSANVSAQAEHLVKNPSRVQMVRGSDASQDNFLYFINPSDHTITSFQFSYEQGLAALTPITFQKDANGDPTVQLVDLVVIDNYLYVLKYLTLSNRFVIDVMVMNAFIDTYIDTSMPLSGVITGLELYEGYNVQVVYQNQDLGEYLVSGGTITVLNPNEIADTVFVGFLYDVELVPMYIFAGAMGSPLYKRISKIYVDYENSLDFQINGLQIPFQYFQAIQDEEPLEPRSDTANIDPVMGWERYGVLRITQSAPFDLQITGIAYFVDIAAI